MIRAGRGQRRTRPAGGEAAEAMPNDDGSLLGGVAKGAAKGTGKVLVGTTKVAGSVGVGVASGVAEAALGGDDSDEELVVPEYGEPRDSPDPPAADTSGRVPMPTVVICGTEVSQGGALAAILVCMLLLVIVGLTVWVVTKHLG